MYLTQHFLFICNTATTVGKHFLGNVLQGKQFLAFLIIANLEKETTDI